MSERNGQYDVAIIGGGPAGYVAAIRAQQLGAKAVVIEKQYWGGVCLNVGCIPTKTMVSTVEVLRLANMGADLGLKGGVEVDYSAFLDRRGKVTKQLVGGVQGLLKANGATQVFGTARLTAPGELEVQGQDGAQTIRAKNVLVATGSVPAKPPIPGLDLPGVVDSTGLLALSEQPRELVIIGGGYIGIEFGSIFTNLGTKVTVIEMLPRILMQTDEELAKRLTQMLKRDGIEFHFDSQVNAVEEQEGKLAVRYTEKGQEKTATGDTVLYATSRRPYAEGLGLEELGVEMNGRAIKVNASMETNVPGVYAAGDVIGGIMLAHVAWEESKVAVSNMLGKRAKMEYHAVPAVVYSTPELASVGLTEAEAHDQGYEVKVGRFPFSANGRALGMNEAVGMVKIVSEGGSGEILGAHILGPHASDLIAEPVIAMEMGATAEDIDLTIHAHPTLPESIQEAALGTTGKMIHYIGR
ncbi:MAG: dihydrolipoyl dehydrogenase [Chloroflexota bacterium]|nr:dihydrolipoyl dehydrogenase [Chloroflexota bacterium]